MGNSKTIRKIPSFTMSPPSFTVNNNSHPKIKKTQKTSQKTQKISQKTQKTVKKYPQPNPNELYIDIGRTQKQLKKMSKTKAQTTKLMQPLFYSPKNDAWEGWKKRICIAVPTTGLVRIEWVMARFGQIIPCNWSNGDIFQYFDMYSPMGYAVAEARNICCEYFISQGFDWIFFNDHDVLLPPDTFLKITDYMNKAEYPIVSGLYYCKGSHPEPLIFRGRGNSYYTKWKQGDKVMVDGIPLGCALIHRSIIKRLYDTSEVVTVPSLAGPVVVRKIFETPRKAWFDPEEGKYQSQTGTEDLFMCDRIVKEKVFENCGVQEYKKFQKMKYPFLMDTSIKCGHIAEDGKIFK